MFIERIFKFKNTCSKKKPVLHQIVCNNMVEVEIDNNKDNLKNFRTIALKINDKLHTIIISGQTTLVSQNYLTLWIISLTLGLSSFIFLSLLPYGVHPDFSLIKVNSNFTRDSASRRHKKSRRYL